MISAEAPYGRRPAPPLRGGRGAVISAEGPENACEKAYIDGLRFAIDAIYRHIEELRDKYGRELENR